MGFMLIAIKGTHLSGITMIFDEVLTTGSSCHATEMSPRVLVVPASPLGTGG